MSSKKIKLNAAKVIKHMTEAELKNYNIELTPLGGMSDHELLLEIAKDLKEFKKEVNDRFDNLIKKNNLVE